MTPYDVRAFVRAMIVAGACALLTWTILWTTEVTGGEQAQLARLVALSPLFATAGALMASTYARRRGELAALTGLGASPMRVYAGPLVAVVVVAGAAVAVLLTPTMELASLFPQVVESKWERSGDEWVNATTGASINADGGLTIGVARRVASAPGWSRGMVAASVGATVLSLGWFALQVGVRWWTILVVAAALLGQIAAYHAVAAGRTTGIALFGPPVVLAGAGAMQAILSRWKRT